MESLIDKFTPENSLSSECYEYLCPENLFRFFIRRLYTGIKISNEEIDGIRKEFAKYLEDLNLNEHQKKKILIKNEIDVILNIGHPLRMHGFPPAYVMHFTLFIEKVKKEVESNPNTEVISK